MLVLCRKASERLIISDNVVVSVLSIRGKEVRLGIEAPSGMRVDRSEVRDRMAGNMAIGGREEDK